MKLLIDLGNTRAKWALWNGVDLQATGAAPHVEFADSIWHEFPRVDSIWVASVAAAALNERIAAVAQKRFGMSAQFVRSRAQACGVRNAYAQPEQLGVDRFLALIAAHAHACEPSVIASCGTALTLDALAADGTHLGGLIAASPELALAALRGGTANLGVAPPGHVAEIAANTADAMASGAWLGAVALVERFVAQTAQHFGANPAVVLTGGAASCLGELLHAPHRIDTELVLRGLAVLADHSG